MRIYNSTEVVGIETYNIKPQLKITLQEHVSSVEK